MFFRIWFLVLYKVAILAMVLLITGFVTHFSWSPVVLRIGIWILVPFAALSTLMVLSWPFTGARIRCPICNSVGTLVNLDQRQPGVECPKCGLVYANDFVWSFRLTMLPVAATGTQTGESAENYPALRAETGLHTAPNRVTHFRTWRTGRWFLLMLVPVFCSALGAFLQHGIGVDVFGVAVLGVAFTEILFGNLYSGVFSSNWGKYSRRHEPVGYWLGTGVWIAAYVLISVAGYFVP